MFSVPVEAGASVEAGAAVAAGSAAGAVPAGLSRDEQPKTANTQAASASDLTLIALTPVGCGPALLQTFSKHWLLKPHPQFVEAMHERRRVRELRAFGQRRLLEQHQREVAELLGTLALLQVLHQVVVDVELQHRP